MAEEDLKAKGRNMARYALLNEFRQKLFKYSDFKLKESSAKASSSSGGNFAKALAQCNQELRSTFGMELIEARPLGLNEEKIAVDNELKRQALKNSHREKTKDAIDTPTKAAKSQTGASATKEYILRSALGGDLIYQVNEIVNDEIPEDDRDDGWLQEKYDVFDWRRGHEVAFQGILVFILSLILTHGQSIGDQDLRNYLKRLHIDENWSPPSTPACMHPPNNLTALLDDFLKRRYLEYSGRGGRGNASQLTASQAVKRRQSQGPQRDGQDNVWRWGARAEVEFGQEGIARFITDTFEEALPNANRAPAHNSGGDRNTGLSIDRALPFSRDRMLLHITKAAGILPPQKLKDADELEPELGKQPHRGEAHEPF
ncbi:hypothetical protein CROQUDRAFT_669691 [Cronartium quercuum f. sp. fusiforme G11]|uniref:MAGE domain-containing protein n=1 Tax=Cronartium quercuum f. sp. fusiforme G11 TaxID=708437 RepID=A0A9P6NKR0_9BASI|nr:hypothetical protein CROQUDRAFT_669691 [Cronartium quercuum f. sp. fusiforme G11]